MPFYSNVPLFDFVVVEAATPIFHTASQLPCKRCQTIRWLHKRYKVIAGGHTGRWAPPDVIGL